MKKTHPGYEKRVSRSQKGVVSVGKKLDDAMREQRLSVLTICFFFFFMPQAHSYNECLFCPAILLLFLHIHAVGSVLEVSTGEGVRAGVLNSALLKIRSVIRFYLIQ